MHCLWKPPILAAALLLMLCAGPGRAAVSVTPAQPARGESIHLQSDQPGTVRWGVNGFRLPSGADRPAGSSIVDQALETRLVAHNGSYGLTLGPFENGAVHELNFAIRLDSGGWDNNQGANYRVAFSADPRPRRPISIGRGPRLGTAMGRDFYEEFQDWSLADAHALDPFNDRSNLYDGGDDSRDLIAFYSRREDDTLYLRADFFDLAMGAEQQLVNIAFLIDFSAGGQEWLPAAVQAKSSHPWELAVIVEATHRHRVVNAAWQTVSSPNHQPGLWKGAYFRNDLDAVECGLSLQALRDHGWDGQSPLRFQVFSWKPGVGEIADAVGEADIDDRRLDDSLGEQDQVSTAKYSAVLHGNQTVKPASEIFALIRNERAKTPRGHPTGYHRALQTHEMFDVPVNIHVSGTFAASLQWARHPDAGTDGRSFNLWIKHLLRTERAALIGGVLADHIAPFFEGSGVNETSVRWNHDTLEAIYQVAVPRIYWTPERVIRGATFEDIKSSGYGWTVLDQHSHIWQWYGKHDALSKRGYKIQRINGVQCFLINEEPDRAKFTVTDDGAFRDTRALLLGKAMDPDQEQIVIVFDDWEAYAGRSFTSFGIGNDNPDNYHLSTRWLANHPWVQIVTLDEVASWNWKPVERGQNQPLPLTTYHWLNHASETDYSNWVYGSSGEESLAAQYPPLRQGQNASKRFGDVWTAGTLFHDTWNDVQTAPPGPLKDLAEVTYCAAIFETAWHDEDQHNYQDQDGAGRYLAPDSSYDRISAWAYGAHNKVRDASIIAAAAHWAANAPASQTRTRSMDVDQDGELETVLSNDRVFAVFENDGGRLVMAFARRLSDGQAYPVVGASIVDPGARRESELEANQRVSALRDQFAGGSSSERYVNAHYTVTASAQAVRLVSDDGRISKTVTLLDGADRLEVEYQVDPSLGTLYVRTGLCPNLLELFTAGQPLLQVTTQGSGINVRTVAGGATVQGRIESPTVTSRVSDGSFDNGLDAALVQQLEVSGQGTFSFSLSLSAW